MIKMDFLEIKFRYFCFYVHTVYEMFKNWKLYSEMLDIILQKLKN